MRWLLQLLRSRSFAMQAWTGDRSLEPTRDAPSSAWVDPLAAMRRYSHQYGDAGGSPFYGLAGCGHILARKSE